MFSLQSCGRGRGGQRPDSATERVGGKKLYVKPFKVFAAILLESESFLFLYFFYSKVVLIPLALFTLPHQIISGFLVALDWLVCVKAAQKRAGWVQSGLFVDRVPRQEMTSLPAWMSWRRDMVGMTSEL